MGQMEEGSHVGLVLGEVAAAIVVDKEADICFATGKRDQWRLASRVDLKKLQTCREMLDTFTQKDADSDFDFEVL